MNVIAKAVEKAWYQQHLWIWILLPLMWLFAGISALRRGLYRAGVKKSVKPNVPVVVVGNISVGGTGKTPLVIALCQALLNAGFTPGVVSRGYGGRLPDTETYPALVSRDSAAQQVGDEPALMTQNLNCAVMIDPIRSRAATVLVEQYHCDVIVCDDGLQHYALGRDVEIVVVDATRRFGNQQLLPVGPLREGTWRLNQVDFIVCNQTGGDAATPPKNSDYVEHPMLLQAKVAVNVLDNGKTRAIGSFEKPVVAMAGIGHPQRFFTMLESKGLALAQSRVLADHHAFTASDIPDAALGSVLMTEKDAVKCRHIAHSDCWYVPVEAQLSAAFLQQFIEKITTSQTIQTS